MAGRIETYRGKRGDTYRLIVDAGRDRNGKRVRATKQLPFGTTKKEAERELAAFTTDIDRDRVKVGVNKLTLGELHDEWKAARWAHFSTHTRRGYTRDWKRIPDYLKNMKLSRLTNKHLDVFYGEMLESGLAKTTVNHFHTLISSILTAGVLWDRIPAPHAAQRARPPANECQPRLAPEPAAVVGLLTDAMEKDFESGLYFRLCATTGARRGEIAALTWASLRDDAVTIAFSLTGGDEEWGSALRKDTKTHQVRTVGLDETTLALLRQHRLTRAEQALAAGCSLPDDGYVFAQKPDGTDPVHPDTWSKRWANLCRHSGVSGVRLHDLRHFVGTELADVLPMPVVMRHLGHSRMTTTQQYAGAKASRDRASVTAMTALLG